MDNVLSFPNTTLVNKIVPKKAFYKRAAIGQQRALKDSLTNDFESITFLYKVTAETLNVADGEQVHEIDIFCCQMKSDTYSISSFQKIDELLPRHTLFIILCGSNTDIIMHHKESYTIKGEERWRLGDVELQRNIDVSSVKLRLERQNMDRVYASLLGQISGLSSISVIEYKELAEQRKISKQLQQQVVALQKKIRLEKQYNKQIELNTEVRKLKQEINELNKK